MALQNSRFIVAWPPIGMTAPNLFSHTTIDAAGEYFSWVFYALEDMTISHVYLKVQTATGSPTCDLRIETVDASTGLPSGTLWGTNTNIVTGTLTTTGTVHALTASASVTKGQWVCVKALYNSGTSFQINNGGAGSLENYSTSYVATNTGTPAKGGLSTGAVGVGSSATNMYYLGGNMWPFSSVGGSGNINNSNGARSGVRFQVPFACDIIGARLTGTFTNDFDITAYDDAGSAITGVTGSFDGSLLGATGNPVVVFGTAFTPTINTWYRIAVVPTTASNVFVNGYAFNDMNMKTGAPGRGFYNRTDYTTSGGWSDTNEANFPMIQLLTRQYSDDVGGGSGTGESFAGYVA